MSDIKFLNDDNEVIRIDAKGFHYRGQFIADAGEAHRLLVEFLRKHQPEGNWQHADAEPKPEGPTVMEIIELADEVEAAGLGQVDLVRTALARWGQPS